MDILNFTPKKIGLSNNQLKIIAMISMLIDHIGHTLFPNVIILRILGRIAFPIFAYMIAEGCLHTKNRLKYLLHLLILGLGCQIVYFIAMGSLYQGILLTFSLSIILIYTLDYFIKKKNVLSFIIAILTTLLIITISGVLPYFFKKSGFEFDYGLIGVFAPVLIYYAKHKLFKLIAVTICIVLLAIQYNSIEIYSLIALLFLVLYNNKRGKYNLKYMFYIFYPLHLVVVYLLSLMF